MGLSPLRLRIEEPNTLAPVMADALLTTLEESIRQRSGPFRVALAGGNSPRRLHEELARRIDNSPHADEVWSSVAFYFGDERAVPPTHDASNFAMARASLGPRAVLHRMRGEAEDLAAEALRYEQELADAFGATPGGEPPVFDLVLLGMGADGHTASLFPDSSVLAENSAWVAAAEGPPPHRRRLTLTFPVLGRAARIWILTTGVEKAATLAEVLHGPTDWRRLPIQRLARLPATTWWLDPAAASQLAGSESSSSQDS